MILAQNHSVGDTSMKFGTNVLGRSCFEKKVLAIKNFNMAAIISKMAARSSLVHVNLGYNHSGCDRSMESAGM